MSDTPPAGTGSGADPVEEPAPSSPALNESELHEPASNDETAEHPLSSRDGVGSAGDSGHALLWPPQAAAVSRPPAADSDLEPTERIPTAPPRDAESADGVARSRSFGSTSVDGMGRDAWPLPEAESLEAGPGADAPQPRASGWSAVWPWGLRGIIETVEVLALALLMFLLVRSVAQNFVVDGNSMQPTFHDGEMLIVNKLAYRTFDMSWLPFTDKDDWRPFGTPQPGDVVVFKFPQDQTRDFIKRVVAVPGQTVEVHNGQVFIDGVPQNEPYLDQAPTYDYGPTTVPEGQIFVLGDNRNNSYDSHSWGLLDQSLLIGRAEFRYWPLDRVGRVGHGGLSAGAAVTIHPTEAPSSSSTTR